MVRRAIVSLADAFVTNGSLAAEYLLSLGAPADRIVRARYASGLAPSLLALADRTKSQLHRADAPHFLYVGRLIRRKGLASLQRAFSTVRASLPLARLSVVGDGVMLADLRSWIEEVGGVTLAGHAEGPDLVAFFEEADVLVVPSEREVWGHVIHEGLAAGLEVVATDEVGAAADLLSDGLGVVVPARDPDALAAAMLRAAARLPSSPEVVAKRRTRAAEVTADQFASAVLRAARIALGRRRSRRA